MSHLLDCDVLIARSDVDHVHHEAAIRWLVRNEAFAVCPMSEGAMVRYFCRTFQDGGDRARIILKNLAKTSGYEFWPDDLSYGSMRLERLQGHKQVTDAYLVALAAHHGGRLATLDRALAAVHPESVLVPTP